MGSSTQTHHQQHEQRGPGLRSACAYLRGNCYELPANILEGITLVLVVFVQDVAFKESIVICGALLTVSFVLHALAYRAGQCQVWPKVVELTAPIPFYALTVPAYLATAPTQKAMFIVLNFFFVAAELVFMACGHNFIEQYYNDWNPREMWGTPLLRHCASVTTATWLACQVIMGLAQVVVVVCDITLQNNLAGAVFMCYVMQLLPLLWAIAWTFAYPAWVRRRWGYVPGDSATCYPPGSRHLLQQLQQQASSSGGSGCSSERSGSLTGSRCSELSAATSTDVADACIQICASGELSTACDDDCKKKKQQQQQQGKQ